MEIGYDGSVSAQRGYTFAELAEQVQVRGIVSFAKRISAGKSTLSQR